MLSKFKYLLQGIEIKAIGSDYAQHFFTVERSQELVIKGVFPEIFYELAKKLNFTYKINISKDGTWSGMINDLKNEVFDIGTAGFDKH